MVENQLEVIVKESGLSETKAQIILKKFQDYFMEAARWELKAKTIFVVDAKQTDDMAEARKGRLFLRAKRIDVENTRKELKEECLREGKAIDGIANVLKALIIPVEEYLDRQEKFIEIKAAERAEEARLLGEKIMEEQRIEKERVEAQRQVELMKENERLKKEAEEREKQIKAEREAQEKIQKERESKLKKEAEEKIKIEREAKEKLEQQIKEKEKAEQRELQLKAEKAEELANSSDKEKLIKFANDIKAIIFPSVKSKKSKELLVRIETVFSKIDMELRNK